VSEPTDADRAAGQRITQTVPGGLMADAIAQALADSPERALLRRIIAEVSVFAEPGGQPAWLGGSVNIPLSREEMALVEQFRAEDPNYREDES
jgi:hypothetical protein